MKELECPACGEMIPNASLYCDMCGKQLLQCIKCGTLGTGQFCPNCGKPMIARNPVTEIDKEKRTIGNQKKTLVLKARKGGFIIKPQDGAIIGRENCPYAELKTMNLISRKHGKFEKQGRDWYIVDFGSTNGTLVNDTELKPKIPMKFAKGDVIDIGTYIFDVIEQ